MTIDIQKATKFMVHNLEAFVWLGVIIYFAASPVHFGNHFTICPLSLADFEHCPGCGLGGQWFCCFMGK